MVTPEERCEGQMAGESRLRVARWLRRRTEGTAGTGTGTGTGGEGTAGEGTAGDSTGAGARADDSGPYRGRRRHLAERPPRATAQRRVSVVAVAVGVVLVGTSVVVALVSADRASLPSPPPTPPQGAITSPDGQLDGETTGPDGSPAATTTPSPTAPGLLTLSFEAEAAQPGSHGQVVQLGGASQGQAVRLSGAREGTFVEFTGVEVATAGGYDLTVFYVSEKDRDGGVSVNGDSPDRVGFAGGGENGTIGSVSLRVELAAGSNTILIGTSGGAPVSLDRITVTG